MDFLLMNHNIPWLLFVCGRDEYGEITVTELEWFTDLRPIGYTGLYTFLERRKAPKHRKHIEQLLERYGCNDLDGFLQVTHALSLNDTFWVKEADSTLSWEEVSLYRNKFNEIIAEAAFDGAVSQSDFSSTSPEFATDGYYAKCWVREPSGIFLYKSGSSTYEIEPLSEFLASQLASILCPNYVEYDLGFYHNRLVSKCALFTDEKVGLAKIANLVGAEKSIAKLLSYYESIGSGEHFRRMCILDALTLNVDRHLGNFGVLVNNSTQQVVQMSPIFDNNRALCFDLDNEQLSHPERYLHRKKPAIGSDFIAAARGLMTDSIRQDLLNLKGFSFRQHPLISAEQERLDLLSRLVNLQLKAIL